MLHYGGDANDSRTKNTHQMELRTWKLQMLSLTCESDELITPIRTFRSSLRLRGGLSVSGTIGKSGTICILVFLVSGFLVSWRRYPSLDYWSPPRRLRLLLTSGTSGRDPNIHLGLAMELRAFSSLPHRGVRAQSQLTLLLLFSSFGTMSAAIRSNERQSKML